MLFSFEEISILKAFQYNSSTKELRRDEIVLFTYDRLTNFLRTVSDSVFTRYQKFESLLQNNSVDLVLIQKINSIINEMISNGKLQYSGVEASDKYLHYKFSDIVIHVLSHGDTRNIKVADLTQQTLDKAMSLHKQEKIRSLIHDDPLSPNFNVNNCFEYREIIPDYREYNIPRSRWSDIEGITSIEIQFFKYYVMLIERGHYTDVAIVDKTDYLNNPSPKEYLCDPSSNYHSYFYRDSVKHWEPLNGLLQDSITCYLHNLNEFSKGEEFMRINSISTNFKSANLKVIDLIHLSANSYFVKLSISNIFGIRFSENELENPWWMIDAKMRRDTLEKSRSIRSNTEEFDQNYISLEDELDLDCESDEDYKNYNQIISRYPGAIPFDMVDEMPDCFKPLVDDGQYE